MARPRRIALLISQDIGFCRRVLEGVHDYAVTQRWLFHDAPADVRALAPMRRWKPDGVICGLFDEQIARGLERCPAPVVNTASMVMSWQGPLVDVDHQAVGRMAGDHLLERGLRHFGFFGSAHAGCSVGREAGFRERLAERGFSLSVCHAEYRPIPPVEASWTGLVRPVRNWLMRLPKPVGILASHDRPGRDLAETCVQIGLRVPDEVAILGVDDDEFECKLSHPPLSSVKNPGVQVGYEAAALLDRLMAGEKPERQRIFVSPSYVAARRSTETTALADPDVAMALVFIREHLANDISVDDVAEIVGTSRRTLERRFTAALGNSILGEIQRMRIERAKHLLAETDLKLSVIAQQCGIRSSARFASVFKRMTGHRPSVFRWLAGDRILGPSEMAAHRAESSGDLTNSG